MSSAFHTNQLMGDWASVNFHYSFPLQQNEQKQIVATVMKAIGEPFEAIKMGEYKTAFQTKNFKYVSINKRFCQVHYQGKHFLEGGLSGAGRLSQKIYDELMKLEKIEGRKDTNITVSLSRLDIQKTVVSPFDFELIDIHKSFDSVSSFRHTIYGGKEAGKPYKVYGETIKDKVRWKLRRYDKTFQILSEYNEDEKKLFFSKYPNVDLKRIELQISDTPFLSQFLQSFLTGEIDLVDILKKWNKRRKVDIIENELIQTSPLIESSLKTFNQKWIEVGLCKAHPKSILDNLKNLNDWIDSDPLAKPEEVINQMIFAMGHPQEVADQVKKIWFKV